MADKLPPVFVVFSSSGPPEGVAQLTISEQRAARYVEMEHACGWDDARAERYEPAVPRCKTCDQFGQPHGHRVHHCHLTNQDVKPDGSGYCSNHPEAHP